MSTYITTVQGAAGPIEIDVHYRIKPWGVDLDEIYISGTDTVLPLSSPEYAQITREITAHRAAERDKR